MDEWTKNVSNLLQREANLTLFEMEKTGEGDVGATIQNVVAYLVPAGFEVTYETTVYDNFVIDVWNPDGFRYKSSNFPLTARSDPLVDPPPSPSHDNFYLNDVDDRTIELLYRSTVAVGAYMRENSGEAPPEDWLLTEGVLPQFWEYALEPNPTSRDYILRVWNEDGEIFDSKEGASYHDTYPKDAYRPNYNCDVSPFVPVTGATIPTDPDSPIPTVTAAATPSGT